MVNAISAVTAQLVKSFFMTILLSIFFKSMPGRSAGNQNHENAQRRRDRTNRRCGYAVRPWKTVRKGGKRGLGAAPEHRAQNWDSWQPIVFYPRRRANRTPSRWNIDCELRAKRICKGE
jgi:hypothetical protein